VAGCPAMITLALRSCLRPRIGSSRAFSLPWSHLIPLLASWSVRCHAAGSGGFSCRSRTRPQLLGNRAAAPEVPSIGSSMCGWSEAGATDKCAGHDRARGERDLAAGRFAGCRRPSFAEREPGGTTRMGTRPAVDPTTGLTGRLPGQRGWVGGTRSRRAGHKPRSRTRCQGYSQRLFGPRRHRALAQPRKQRLDALDQRPRTFKPMTAFAQADAPSRLVEYYLLDTTGYQPQRSLAPAGDRIQPLRGHPRGHRRAAVPTVRAKPARLGARRLPDPAAALHRRLHPQDADNR
jgi:hypothetical protein